MTELAELLTNKQTLNHTRIASAPLAPMAASEALLRIRRVALTTNNITYAAFGEAMQYWGFFPAGEAGWGKMPAWGFAEVEESTVPGLERGERFYGYFPLATHLRVQPVRVTERGFFDGAEHRKDLVSAYNHYVRTSADPVYRPQLENFQALLRPLFITSFMLTDFLQDNGFFGAKRLVFSSASSKTAYGTAFCLDAFGDVERVALTSTRNRAFTEQLGCYHRTLDYTQVDTLGRDVPTLYVDFSGDEQLRERIHLQLGDALVYDCFAGSAQNTQFLRDTALPGPKPVFYFAPVQIRKRNVDWGYAEVNRRFDAAQLAFIHRVGNEARPWMQVREHDGLAAAQALIEQLVRGQTDPREGHMVVIDR